MPHYRNGLEAHEGDHVIVKDGDEFFAGVLTKIALGACSCNAQVVFAVPGGVDRRYITIAHAYAVKDAYLAIEPRVTVSCSATTCEVPTLNPA